MRVADLPPFPQATDLKEDDPPIVELCEARHIFELNDSRIEISGADLQVFGDVVGFQQELAVEAFDLRVSPEFAQAQADRPFQGLSWGANMDGLQAPKGLPHPEFGARPPNQFTGSIAVGIIFVSGPEDLEITRGERGNILCQVQDALSWMGPALNGPNPITFNYRTDDVHLDLYDDPSGHNKEAYWLVPALKKLGFKSPCDYIEKLITEKQTDYGYCAFFVKYSLDHFAYAHFNGYIVMHYENDEWGTNNIKSVFAHETGHVFQAPDEYSDEKTGTKCSCLQTFGIYHVVNGNCESCADNGGVPCIMRRNDFAVCGFTPWHMAARPPMLPMIPIFNNSNMGQGHNAVEWLIGDVTGSGRDEVVQLWANGSRLGMIVYGWEDNTLKTIWATSNTGQGSGAVDWLIGDVTGDGKANVIQLWSNDGRLGMIVYGWNGSEMVFLWGYPNMGQGSQALAWLIGDVNEDGQEEVIQLWSNDGWLGMIVYGWNVGGYMQEFWNASSVAQGAQAVKFLIGSVSTGSRRQIVQEWPNGPSLGTILYSMPHKMLGK